MSSGVGGENNKGTDQSAHSPSLISAFVIHILECIIFILAKVNFNFLVSL